MSSIDEKSPINYTITLPEDIAAEISHMTGRTDRSTSEIIAQALNQYLFDDKNRNAVYLSAPVNALMKGLYEENTPISYLKQHGDFGLGTFNNLDGEMVMLDGKVYQLNADGLTYDVDDTVQTPFACITFFLPDITEEISGEFDYAAFNTLLDRLIPSKNMLYAIRIDGIFNYVNVWSVHRQENYTSLTNTEEIQPSFEYHNIEGTMAGFYMPKFIRSLCMPGYHLHFLTADRKYGGHLHECRLKQARISIQQVPRLKMDLPLTLDYLTAKLTR